MVTSSSALAMVGVIDEFAMAAPPEAPVDGVFVVPVLDFLDLGPAMTRLFFVGERGGQILFDLDNQLASCREAER